MFNILVLAGGRLLGWVLGSGTMKWALAAFLWYFIGSLLAVVISLLPDYLNAQALTGAASSFTPAIWYFVDYFQLEEGLSMVLGAYVTRFIIRRLPFVG